MRAEGGVGAPRAIRARASSLRCRRQTASSFSAATPVTSPPPRWSKYSCWKAWCSAHSFARGSEAFLRGEMNPARPKLPAATETQIESQAPPAAPTRAAAFRYWWKLGWMSCGGPAGQIAIMHHDLVERMHWISERRFLHALNYCMVLPGPEAQQLATYIGWLMHRTWGGIVAGTLFVLPSLFVLIALSWVYMAYGDVPAVSGILYGIKPAATAIVLQAVHRVGSRALKGGPMIGLAA